VEHRAQMQVNARTLTDMPNVGALFAAVQALTNNDVRNVSSATCSSTTG
jgi:hypothetical protein